MAAEEAKYTVSVQQDKLEIRAYAPSIVAEVVVDGTLVVASGAAFRKLFNYIVLNNGTLTYFVSKVFATKTTLTEYDAQSNGSSLRARTRCFG